LRRHTNAGLPGDAYLAATRALDQKIAAAGSGTEIVDQIREADGRAPASSQRISMAGVVHRYRSPTGMRSIATA
jgi:hypothetical protein